MTMSVPIWMLATAILFAVSYPILTRKSFMERRWPMISTTGLSFTQIGGWYMLLPPLIVATATVITWVSGNSPHSSYLATNELGKIVGLTFGVVAIFRAAPLHADYLDKACYPVFGLLFFCFILVFTWLYELGVDRTAWRLISHPATTTAVLSVGLPVLTLQIQIILIRVTRKSLQ